MTRQQMGHDIGALTKRAALGSVAGLAGTIVLHGLTKGRQRVAPTLSTPLAKDPGELVVEKAESFLPESARPSIPKNVETIAARLLAMGYGMAFGALYGLMQSNEHKDNNHLIAEGAALGAGTWAAGYLGWLPVSGAMPPVWKQEPGQAAAPVVEHTVYGIVTASAYEILSSFLSRGAQDDGSSRSGPRGGAAIHKRRNGRSAASDGRSPHRARRNGRHVAASVATSRRAASAAAKNE